MFPSSRFSFEQPADSAAQKLFAGSHSLQLNLSRGGQCCGPLLTFTLEGWFSGKDHDLQRMAAELLAAFAQLGPVGTEGADDDDENCFN